MTFARAATLASIAVLATAAAAAPAQARSLYVKIYEGNVPAKDAAAKALFNSDPSASHSNPYVSVSVCGQSARTPAEDDTTKPRWDWSHTFTNVTDDCQITFHVYNDDVSAPDEDLGQAQMPVGQFLHGEDDQRQIVQPGPTAIEVKGRWE